MLRTAFAVSIVLASASAAQALERPPLCQALNAMAAEARRSGEPQRVSTSESCRPGAASPAQAAFCEAAKASPGHRLPWAIHDCVNTMAGDPRVTVGPADPDLPKGRRLAHLAAKLGHGVRLDVAASDGGYAIVVWRPR